MNRHLALALLLPMAMAAQTIDLAGEWRSSDRDDLSYASPSTDDGHWSTTSLPAHNRRLPEGLWLRRTIVVPEGATTLVLGRLPQYRLYLNGVAHSVSGGPGPHSYRLPNQGSPLTIAIRVGAKRILGPNQLPVDEGPYLLTTETSAGDAIQQARSNLQRQLSSPYILLAGCQLTLGIALLLIWFLTERQYGTLFWLAVYVLYTSQNMLRVSLLPQLPPTPQFISAMLALQLTVAIAGRDSRRNTLALWGIYVALLAAFGKALPSVVTNYADAVSRIVAVGIMAWHAWRTPGRARLTSIIWGLYCMIIPIGVWLREPLLLESSVGFWPILGLLNVPLTFTVVLLFTAQFAGDRRERIRLHAEFEAARAVQQLLLPEARLTRGALSIEAVYEPAQEVGGDFYYLSDAGPDGLIVVIGDVTGKGLRAAMIVSLLIGVLRETQENSPAAILHRLNTALLLKANAGFVTCCCARFDANGAVTVANAGHPCPYVDGSELQLEAGLPLGIAPAVEYAESRATGEQFTFVSDGVVEAENARRELFGFERTQEISTQSAQHIADAAKAWGQNDDITVVTVRRMP